MIDYTYDYEYSINIADEESELPLRSKLERNTEGNTSYSRHNEPNRVNEVTDGKAGSEKLLRKRFCTTTKPVALNLSRRSLQVCFLLHR